MDNDRNSDIWRASSKQVENEVAAFLRNGLVERFEQFDKLLKSPEFDIETQVALIRLQVSNYGGLSGDSTVNGSSIQCKKEGTSAGGNGVQGENNSESVAPAINVNTATTVAAETGNGNGVTGDKSTTKRKWVDGPKGDTVSDMDTPTSPPKKQMQDSAFIFKPAGFYLMNEPNGGTGTDTGVGTPPPPPPVSQPIEQMQSSGIIAKQAGIALTLICSVLGDLNLLERQLNLMMTGPTEMIDLMDKTYFKGRLSAALESFDQTKDTVQNIDLEMYSYHVKRTKLISELGTNRIATPDILLSVTYLDTYIFRRLHQILTELRNSYYLALTMDHILSEDGAKTENNDNTETLEVDN